MEVIHLEGIVIGISETKYKTYNFGGRDHTYEMRYIRVATPAEGEILVRVTDRDFEELPNDKDGNRTQLKNGDIVNFEHFKKEFKFDNGGIMRTNPRIITVMSHVTEVAVEKYPLNGITFYDWGVQLKNANSVCKVPKEEWDSVTGLETTFHLNKLKRKLKEEEEKEAFVEVQAKFNLYYRWNLNNIFRYHNNGGHIVLVSENLQSLRKVKTDEEEVMRARLLVDEIRQILQNKMFVTYDNIVRLARKYTMPEQDVNEYIKSIVWKKDYDEDFTDWLKEKSGDVLYGMEGLFYCLPNSVTVLEDPVTGKATYVFIGHPDYIASQIEGIRRENVGSDAWREILYRLKKSTPEKTIFFVGRVVHFDKDQWMRDMEVVLKTATSDAPTVLKQIPDDPKKRRSTTSQFLEGEEGEYAIEIWSCNVCKEYPIRVHVKLPSTKTVDGDTKHCPKCNARTKDLTFQKVYKANENGEITE